MKESLLKKLKQNNTLPFLFIGSGISRRYLGLPKWDGLLEKFASNDLSYYRTQVDGNYQKMGSTIAEEFHESWYKDEKYNNSRSEVIADGIKFNRKSHPFKYEVSKFFKDADLEFKSLPPKYLDEIKALKKAKISGVITTNYDLFIEEIFDNKFKKYIGQEDMLFNKSYEIGELYKIHGCCTDFNSIVITEKDYQEFEEKNKFLTSKLLSFFIEYPIIFLGYSFNDDNIKGILKNIVLSIGEKNINKLKDRLFFVERSQSNESMTEKIISFDDINLPFTYIQTDNYQLIYECLGELTQSIPAHVIRQLKNNIYNIVQTTEPTSNVLVRYEDIDNLENLQVVIGIGVIDEFSTKGYSCLEAYDLFENLLKQNLTNRSAEKMVANVLPKILSKGQTKYIPIFQYIKEIGINKSNYSSKSLIPKLTNIIEFKNEDFLTNLRTNLEFFTDATDRTTIDEIVFLVKTNNIVSIDVEKYRCILEKYLNILVGDSSKNPLQVNDFKVLCCLYDRLKYWED